MNMPVVTSNFGPGFGFGSGFPSQAAPMYIPPAVIPPQKQNQTVLTPKNIQAYLIYLAALNYIGTDATQRLSITKAIKDYQQSVGIPFAGRFATSVLFTMPLVVTYQTVTSARAKARMLSMCNLPLDLGEGDKAEPMFYYNTATDTCTMFNYKGSKGNENMFSTKDKCEFTCRPNTEEGRAALKRKITLAQIAYSSVELANVLFGTVPSAAFAVSLTRKLQMDMPR